MSSSVLDVQERMMTAAVREEDPGNTLLSSVVRVAVVVALIAYAAFGLYRLGASDLDGDEGRYGISALNILRDHRQLAIVSPDPDGAPWSTWPFAYPTLIAGSILLLGKNEVALRVVNVLLLALTSACVYRITRSLLQDRIAALLASGLFLLNPATIAYARSAMAETSILFWGCAALVAAASYKASGRSRYAVLCGAALGLGFLSKLWLILPFCGAATLLVLCRSVNGKWGRPFRDAGLGLAVFLMVSGSHLLLLRLLAPESLKTWLATYFLGAATTRLAGTGYDPEMWYRPGWFYLAILFKSQLFGLPLLSLGISDLVRRRRFLVLSCLVWLLGPILVLSFFKIKEAPYICQAYPALAMLMACGFRPFFQSARALEVVLSTLASVAFAMFFLAVGALTRGQFILILALYAMYLIAAPMKLLFFPWRRRAAIAAAVASLLFADGVVVSRQLQHRTHYREIAEYFSPRLGPLRPGIVIFTAPEYPALGFYLFRQGEYWDSYYVHISDESFRYDLLKGNRMFYILDPSQSDYGGRIKPEWGPLLRRNTHDITTDVERATGSKLSFRVLVPLTERQL